MTRTEAINILNHYVETAINHRVEHLKKALNLAIAALQEQKEWNDTPHCPKCGNTHIRGIMGSESGFPLFECLECHWAFAVEARYRVREE